MVTLLNSKDKKQKICFPHKRASDIPLCNSLARRAMIQPIVDVIFFGKITLTCGIIKKTATTTLYCAKSCANSVILPQDCKVDILTFSILHARTLKLRGVR